MQRTGIRFIAAALTTSLVTASVGVIAVAPAQAANCTGSTFTSDCVYTVPAGFRSISVTVAGAAGGSWTANPNHADPGGRGAVVTARINVVPGEQITVLVGGEGESSGAVDAGGAGGTHGGGDGGDGLTGGPPPTGGGGGGGGGYSALKIGSNVLVVAGGGGGASDRSDDNTAIPTGGNAGLPSGAGGDGACCDSLSDGGYSGNFGHGGGAAPGAVGVGGAAPSIPEASAGAGGTTMKNGGTGEGGDAGHGDVLAGGGGGGGGGGYNGGGGGSGNNGAWGGAGGAGSSYVNPAYGTGSFATATALAPGSVTISRTPEQIAAGKCVTPPANIPARGLRQLMKANCRTNTGRRITVRVRGTAIRGDVRLYRVFRTAGGRTMIRTYGVPLRLTVTWTAPAAGNYGPYLRAARYRT